MNIISPLQTLTQLLSPVISSGKLGQQWFCESFVCLFVCVNMKPTNSCDMLSWMGGDASCSSSSCLAACPPLLLVLPSRWSRWSNKWRERRRWRRRSDGQSNSCDVIFTGRSNLRQWGGEPAESEWWDLRAWLVTKLGTSKKRDCNELSRNNNRCRAGEKLDLQHQPGIKCNKSTVTGQLNRAWVIFWTRNKSI